MNAVLLGSIGGLLAGICWGTSDYLSARSTRKASALQVNFTVQTTAIVMVLVLYLLHGLHITSWQQVFYVSLSSIFNTTGYYVFVRALSKGAVGIIVPLSNIYPLVTVGLSVLFLQVDFSARQMAAMLAIIFGAVVLAYEKNRKKVPFRQLHRQTTLTVLAAILWGLAYFTLNPVVGKVDWQSVSIISEWASMIYTLLITLAITRSRFPRFAMGALSNRPAYLTGLVGMSGMMAIYFGTSRAGVVIPTVLSGGGPLIASVWARLIDHERIGWVKRIGAVIVVAGIIILNVS